MRKIALMVLFVAACGSAHPAARKVPAPLASLASAIASAPTCASLLTGVITTAAEKGCRSGDTLEPAITYPCNDGRTLVQFGNVYWGFEGEHARAGDAGNSYDACAKP